MLWETRLQHASTRPQSHMAKQLHCTCPDQVGRLGCNCEEVLVNIDEGQGPQCRVGHVQTVIRLYGSGNMVQNKK